jgi:RNA polymerase sigma-70 factor (sigma-E family)
LTTDHDLAFIRFVEERQLRLTGLAILLTGSQTAGQDLLQEVLEKTYRRWSSGGEIEDVEAYVRAALSNGARGAWRRRARRPEDLVDRPVDSPVSSSESAVVERQALLTALRRLSPRQRTVLVLRYFEDCSEMQIAAVMNCAPGTVKRQASRALERLREDPVLAETFDQPVRRQT